MAGTMDARTCVAIDYSMTETIRVAVGLCWLEIGDPDVMPGVAQWTRKVEVAALLVPLVPD